jgi:hypothetical protein
MQMAMLLKQGNDDQNLMRLYRNSGQFQMKKTDSSVKEDSWEAMRGQWQAVV